MAASLEHVTLTTGAANVSRRDASSDDMIAWARDRLANGDESEGWSVKLIPGGPEAAGMHVFDLLHEGRRVVVCILCAEEAASPKAWRMAKQLPIMPGTRLHVPSQVPWLAVALDPAGLDPMPDPQVLRFAGEIERYVAWALLE